MPMSDEEAYQHYADPDNREPTGRGGRRARRTMSSHVPVRFRPDVIAEVKRLAEEDGLTVSSWIRRLVEREIERRRRRIPQTGSIQTPEVTLSGFEGALAHNITSGAAAPAA